MVAKGRLLEEVFLEGMRYIHTKTTSCCRLRHERVTLASLLVTGTPGDNQLVASLVRDEGAHLTLVALFADAPDEVFAVRAEGGLLEDGGHEAMFVDHMDSTPDGTSSLVEKPMALGKLARGCQGGNR